MRLFGKPSDLEEAAALERAADAAAEDGDTSHERALREAALFKRRVARERAAGRTGWPVAAFDRV